MKNQKYKKHIGMCMGLFDGTGKAAEKEAMVRSTYNACVNYGKSKVDPSSFYGGNRTAWKYLVENEYVETWNEGEQMYCMLTDKCLEKMRNHGIDC